MSDTTFLADEMRRSTRNLLVTAGALGAAAVSLLLASRHPSALAWGTIFGTAAAVALVAALLRIPAGRHPTWRSAARYGDPEEVGREIGLELAGRDVARIDRFVTTPRWLLRKRVYGMDLTRLDEVVWAYRLDTQHSTNGIKTGKTIEVLIHLRSGKCLKFSAGHDYVARQMLERIREKAPWAITGYSPDLEAVWNGARGEMIAMVDGRRAEAAATPGSAPSVAAGGVPPVSFVPLLPSPRANMIFVLGLLGLFTPLGIVAWILGHLERREVERGRLAPSQLVTAGWALGIAGTVIFGTMMLVALAGAHHAAVAR